MGSTNLFFNVSTGGNAHPPPPASSCSCPPKPCQCSQYGNTCSCQQRSSAGAETRFPVRPNDESISSYLMNDLNLGPDLIKKFDANLTSFIDQCKIGSTLAGKSPQSPGMFLPQRRPSSQERIANISPTVADPDYKEMREDICELLEAISAELRGTTEPGSSDYLERELSRYKGFVMSHSDLATHLKSLSSGMKLRYFLLLGLQNDLVKLLSDFLTPPQN